MSLHLFYYFITFSPPSPLYPLTTTPVPPSRAPPLQPWPPPSRTFPTWCLSPLGNVRVALTNLSEIRFLLSPPPLPLLPAPRSQSRSALSRAAEPFLIPAPRGHQAPLRLICTSPLPVSATTTPLPPARLPAGPGPPPPHWQSLIPGYHLFQLPI